MTHKSYQGITHGLSTALSKMRQEILEVMNAFGTLCKSAMHDQALDKKTKEMIALGIAIVTRCDGCIGFHVKALMLLKITREEFMEVLGTAVYMGGGPSLMYSAEALRVFEEFSSEKS
jgi:AhpD family alkylhydroperoxidase